MAPIDRTRPAQPVTSAAEKTAGVAAPAAPSRPAPLAIRDGVDPARSVERQVAAPPAGSHVATRGAGPIDARTTLPSHGPPRMPIFPPEPGMAADLRPRRTDYAGNATVSGMSSVLYVDIEEVKRHLPPGFELQPVPGVPEGKHPVIFEVNEVDPLSAPKGEQLGAAVGAFWGGAMGWFGGPIGAMWGAWFGGLAGASSAAAAIDALPVYDEAILTIPNVKKPGGEFLYQYVPTMQVSHGFAKDAEQQMGYGYNKELSTFEREKLENFTSFQRVRMQGPQGSLQVGFQDRVDGVDASDLSSKIVFFQQLAQQPMLGELPPKDGERRFAVSYLDRDYRGAKVTLAQLNLDKPEGGAFGMLPEGGSYGVITKEQGFALKAHDFLERLPPPDHVGYDEL